MLTVDYRRVARRVATRREGLFFTKSTKSMALAAGILMLATILSAFLLYHSFFGAGSMSTLALGANLANSEKSSVATLPAIMENGVDVVVFSETLNS